MKNKPKPDIIYRLSQDTKLKHVLRPNTITEWAYTKDLAEDFDYSNWRFCSKHEFFTKHRK